MTKVEYIEKFGRTPEEVAHIFHDFIVAPLDWAIEREGSLDMRCPYVWREAIPGTNECRTVGCMGAWISLFFNSSGESTLDVEIEGEWYPSSSHSHARFLLAYLLRDREEWPDNCIPHEWELSPVWHNEKSRNLFGCDDKAYKGDGTTTLSDVKKYFEDAINKLMAMT